MINILSYFNENFIIFLFLQMQLYLELESFIFNMHGHVVTSVELNITRVTHAQVCIIVEMFNVFFK